MAIEPVGVVMGAVLAALEEAPAGRREVLREQGEVPAALASFGVVAEAPPWVKRQPWRLGGHPWKLEVAEAAHSVLIPQKKEVGGPQEWATRGEVLVLVRQVGMGALGAGPP